jgi:hypothetical protein
MQQMETEVHIQLHDLYNFLRYVRHNIPIASLHLNRDNIIEVLSHVFKDRYLNKCRCPCIFSLGKMILFVLYAYTFFYFLN